MADPAEGSLTNEADRPVLRQLADVARSADWYSFGRMANRWLSSPAGLCLCLCCPLCQLSNLRSLSRDVAPGKATVKLIRPVPTGDTPLGAKSKGSAYTARVHAAAPGSESMARH